MKYNEIHNFDDIKKYCSRVDKGTEKLFITSPFVKPTNSPITLLDKHTSPSSALGYRLFDNEVVYGDTVVIKGIIYSYYTPIGLITQYCLMFLNSRQTPFRSVTTKKLLTILNRENYKLQLLTLRQVLNALNIDLGWLD